MSENHPPSSKADRQAAFEAELLRDIESGVLKSGSRLPTTAALAARHALDVRSVQAVLSTLAARGLLERKPRAGTVVRSNPSPRRALFLTGWNLEQEPSYMLRSLVHHLREALAETGYQLSVRHDLHSLFAGDETHFRQECARLKAAMHEEQPAGLIEYQFSLKRLSAIYPEFALPCVSCTAAPEKGDIEYDRTHFIAEALRHLHEQGCRRVLLIRKGNLNDPSNALDDAFWQHLKPLRFKSGEIREVFNRFPAMALEQSAEELLLALAAHWNAAPRTSMPDSLIVQDDIMMRGIATGLLKIADRLPRPLEIVHIANEGIHHHYGLPTTRYELPIRSLAREMARLFDLRLRKQAGRETLPILLRGSLVPASSAPDTPLPMPILQRELPASL